MAELEVKVVPGARREAMVGWLGTALKVRVTAPPERGRANAAVVALVATALGVPSSQVRVIAGHGSPRKRLAIDGLDREALNARIAAALAGEDPA